MLHIYGTSVAGPRHAGAGIPCQDSHASWVSEDGTLAVGAAADGLGSEKHADVGSSVAASAAVAYCREHATGGAEPNALLGVLRSAYAAALEAVEEQAREMGESAGEFDTTLCLALLDGDRLFWGHAGDSGIVAGMADGTYQLLTTMQRDEEGRVFPLCFYDHWEFGALEGVATVLLCTDGVLEGMIAPPVLAANSDCPLDRAKARMFLHPHADDAANLDDVRHQAYAYLEAYPTELIDDDKTVVVLFDDERFPAEQPEEYYAEPDWEAIHARAIAGLYGRDAGAEAAEVPDDPVDEGGHQLPSEGAGDQGPGVVPGDPAPEEGAVPPAPASDEGDQPPASPTGQTPRARASHPHPRVGLGQEIRVPRPAPSDVRDALADSFRPAAPVVSEWLSATVDVGAAVGNGCRQAARILSDWLRS